MYIAIPGVITTKKKIQRHRKEKKDNIHKEQLVKSQSSLNPTFYIKLKLANCPN